MSLILFPFKLAITAVVVPFRVSRLWLRLFRVRGTLGFALGVVVGLLVAPRPGSETRRRLQERTGVLPDEVPAPPA